MGQNQILSVPVGSRRNKKDGVWLQSISSHPEQGKGSGYRARSRVVVCVLNRFLFTF